MPLPYSKTLDNEWARKQNFTEVVGGDEIFEVVKLGAQRLEASWKGSAQNWERLIPKAVKQGFLGWGEPIVRPEWLRHMIFVQEKYWPKGLTPREKLILRLAAEISQYFPGKDMSFSEIIDARANPKAGIIPSGTPEQTLQALKSFALLYEQEVLNDMWVAYTAESKHAAPKIMKACEKIYGEACGVEEARGKFYGYMDRAWKIKTLKISYVTYKVYGLMVDYINLVAGT